MDRMLRLLRIALLAAAATLLPFWAHAASFLVSVDTSTFANAEGFVDFQFNPFAGAAPASATVSGFTGAVLTGSYSPEGDVSGDLPDGLVIGNGTGFNAALQAVRYGTAFSFRVDFGGAPADSSFNLGVYDFDFAPLLGADASGISLAIDFVAPGATPLVTIGAPDFITVTAVEPIPEPATYALMLAGLATLLVTARGRRSVRP
jgi:hypothetical protein